jgi:hypothetical protein
MARYDNIYGAGNVTVEAPPDFWTAAKQSFDDDYDRLVAAQTRQEEKDRYDSEKLEEQTRYNTEQENLMFQQRYDKAVAAHQAAVADYTLASEQIGPENPEMQAKLNKQYSKEYRVPTREGGYETRRVVPQAVVDYNDVQVKSKQEFDFTLSQWDNNLLTNEQKIAAWPQMKRLNKFFNEQLEPYEASYKRALSYNDNKTLLDSMGAFLPAGYTDEKWNDAIEILLKDGEVSEAELKLVASDISTHITNRKAAEKFWSEFSSNVLKARGDLKLDSDPTVIRDLQTMQETALGNLDKYYPGVSQSTDRGKFRAATEKISQDIHGKSFNDLTEEEMKDVTNKAAAVVFHGAGFTSDKTEETEDEVEKKIPLEEQVKTKGLTGRVETMLGVEKGRIGSSVKDPVTGKRTTAQNIAAKLREAPYKYAKKGIIPTDEFPFFKEVTVKEALMHWRKSKKDVMDKTKEPGLPRTVEPIY